MEGYCFFGGVEKGHLEEGANLRELVISAEIIFSHKGIDGGRFNFK